jgi:hypothetical protein
MSESSECREATTARRAGVSDLSAADEGTAPDLLGRVRLPVSEAPRAEAEDVPYLL